LPIATWPKRFFYKKYLDHISFFPLPPRGCNSMLVVEGVGQ
jgi:hypothetical protein